MGNPFEFGVEDNKNAKTYFDSGERGIGKNMVTLT